MGVIMGFTWEREKLQGQKIKGETKARRILRFFKEKLVQKNYDLSWIVTIWKHYILKPLSPKFVKYYPFINNMNLYI